MDNKVRRNEVCIIGLPRCDYVFSSTRSCFIAYGFSTSTLEMTIIRGILEKKGIEAIEAGGMRAPGENAFCVKICSKIITSQFCIVLLNNELKGAIELPNANVNMEYGLMLGFNKYVIPFQREEQNLPFNVSGLDTIKYSNQNFESQASSAIDLAIKSTTPTGTVSIDIDQKLHTFLLVREMTYPRVDSIGDKAIFDLGMPLGFNLLLSFSGMQYLFFGNFTFLRSEAVIWRLKMLCRAIDLRRSSWPSRIEAGLLTKEQAVVFDDLFQRFEILLLVTSPEDSQAVSEALKEYHPNYKTKVISLDDVDRELESLGGALT